MRLTVLNGIRIGADEGDLFELQPKAAGAVFVLAVAGRPVSRTELADYLYSDDVKNPGRALDTLIARLSDQLESKGLGQHLARERKGEKLFYRLALDKERDEFDLAAFRNMAEEAERVSGLDIHRAAELLEDALELWAEPPLIGLPDNLALEELIHPLLDEWLDAIESWSEAQLQLGRHNKLTRRLPTLVKTFPNREKLLGLLMRALDRAERPADARELYRQHEARLARDYNSTPHPALRRLYEKIGHDDPDADLDGVTTPAPPNQPGVAMDVVSRAHRQLPMDIPEFTGRSEELHRVRDLVQQAAETTAVKVVVIEGMAGVGKTRLAVHSAHHFINDDAFNDVQLWADLRGFNPTQQPAEPGLVLEAFLELLGVPSGQIPATLEARAALYRDHLAGQRALVLLDNVADEEQVRPLLPGSPTCLVLVTSRRSLPALDGAYPLRLETLPPDDASTLLGRIAGMERVLAEPDQARRIVELCGHLPLAVALAARRIQTRPAWSLSSLVARLENDRNRLTQLTAGSRAMDTTFDLSYQALTEEQKRLFRLLALHPGEDFTAHTAAALADITPEQAEMLLEALLDEYLLQQTSLDRYRFHDLLRLYAYDRVSKEESPAGQGKALRRLIDWYLATAKTAAGHVELQPFWPSATDILPDEAASSHPGERRLSLATAQLAFDWLVAERSNILSAAAEAANQNWHQLACQLAIAVYPFLQKRQFNGDALRSLHLALTATRASRDDERPNDLVNPMADGPEDRGVEITALLGLGRVYWEKGQYHESKTHYQDAVEVCGAVGDLAGQAWAEFGLGLIFWHWGQYSRAEQHYREAFDIAQRASNPHIENWVMLCLDLVLWNRGEVKEAAHRHHKALAVAGEIKDRRGEAWARVGLGLMYWHLAKYERAEQFFREGLTICRETEFSHAEAWAFLGIGHLNLDLGSYRRAEQRFRKALSLFESTGDRRGEVGALCGLGLVGVHMGDYADAERRNRQALEICRQIGDRHMEAWATHGLGLVYARTGDPTRAGQRYRQALEICRQTGDKYTEAHVLLSLSRLSIVTDQPNAAIDYAKKAIDIWRDMSSPLWEARALASLAEVYTRVNDNLEAAAARRRAAELFEQSNRSEAEILAHQIEDDNA